MPNILTAENVTKRFGGLTAVGRLSIEIPEKSIYSVIGPNGAGKKTFFNCITGFYHPEEGDIIFYGTSHLGPKLCPNQPARHFQALSKYTPFFKPDGVGKYSGWPARPPEIYLVRSHLWNVWYKAGSSRGFERGKTPFGICIACAERGSACQKSALWRSATP